MLSSNTCCIILWNCLLCISLYLGSVIVSYWFFYSIFSCLFVPFSLYVRHISPWFCSFIFWLEIFFTCLFYKFFKGGGSVVNHGSHALFTQFLYCSVLMRQHVAWRLGIRELYFSGCNLAIVIVCTSCRPGEWCFSREASLIYMFKSK